MSAEERPDGELSAGERLTCKVQLHDEYGNCAPVVLGMRDDDELIATLDSPIGPIPLTVKQTMVEEGQNTRQGGKKTEKTTVTQAVGAYEIVSPELARAGEHTVTISLHGEEIKGSPIEFVVKPAAPIATKSWLQLQGTPVVNEETVILLQLVDKYGNYLERGDVRVDAKAYGAKASDCAVTDQENGQYLIKLVAAVPGEYKVQARLENAELNLLPFRVEAASLNQAANAPAPAPAADGSDRARTAPARTRRALRARRRSTRRILHPRSTLATRAQPLASRRRRRAARRREAAARRSQRKPSRTARLATWAIKRWNCSGRENYLASKSVHLLFRQRVGRTARELSRRRGLILHSHRSDPPGPLRHAREVIGRLRLEARGEGRKALFHERAAAQAILGGIEERVRYTDVGNGEAVANEEAAAILKRRIQ